MTKIWGIILCMCFILSETCYAIQFSQPLKIGTIDLNKVVVYLLVERLLIACNFFLRLEEDM